jgi:hypothetical protein
MDALLIDENSRGKTLARAHASAVAREQAQEERPEIVVVASDSPFMRD